MNSSVAICFCLFQNSFINSKKIFGLNFLLCYKNYFLLFIAIFDPFKNRKRKIKHNINTVCFNKSMNEYLLTCFRKQCCSVNLYILKNYRTSGHFFAFDLSKGFPHQNNVTSGWIQVTSIDAVSKYVMVW